MSRYIILYPKEQSTHWYRLRSRALMLRNIDLEVGKQLNMFPYPKLSFGRSHWSKVTFKALTVLLYWRKPKEASHEIWQSLTQSTNRMKPVKFHFRNVNTNWHCRAQTSSSSREREELCRGRAPSHLLSSDIESASTAEKKVFIEHGKTSLHDSHICCHSKTVHNINSASDMKVWKCFQKHFC